MNSSSTTSAGEGEGSRIASPIPIGETKKDNGSDPGTDPTTAPIDKGLSQNSPGKSTSKASSDWPSKAGGAKASPSCQMPTEAGSKRRERHDSAASSQTKKPRMDPSENSVESRVAEAIDDAQTESEDEYSVGAQKSPEAFNLDTAEQQEAKKPAAIDDTGASLEAKATTSFEEQQDANELLESQGPRDEEISLSEEVARSRRVPFPVTLYDVLENDNLNDACCWLPDGLAFALDPEIFKKKVVDVYFRGSKFASCKRKLNRWGFRRVETEAPGTMTYYHPLFRRGYPGLIKQMNGGRLVANKKKTSAQALSNETCGLPWTVAEPEPSPDQQALLAAMLGGGAVSGGLGSLMGGAAMGGRLSSLLAGGPMQFPMVAAAGGGIPFAVAPPQQTSSDAEAMNQIILEQEHLRLELARKDKDELELRQKLDQEVLRRKAQANQMREMLLASPPTGVPVDAAGYSQGFPSQMSQMPPAGFGASMPTGETFPGMSQFPPQQASDLSQLLQQQVQGLAQFPQGPGMGQQSGMAAVDASAMVAAVAAAPCSATSEVDLARFQNMNQQQEQDFQRRVQQELARRNNRDAHHFN